MTNNTALQVTNFNFYGDELIALKDNATGEIYASITHILRGIGFTDNDQIRKRRDKWINDIVISKGIQKFNIPTQEGVSKNGTPINYQEVFCISQHKLPLALAKINITPKMKQNQPELASKLELYQDKCADVLASVFIDNKTTDQITMQPILDTLNTFTKTVNDTLLSLNERMSKLEESQEQVKKSLPKKRFSISLVSLLTSALNSGLFKLVSTCFISKLSSKTLIFSEDFPLLSEQSGYFKSISVLSVLSLENTYPLKS